MFDDGLAQEGVEQFSAPRPQTVAPEQLGVHEPAELAGFGGGKILDPREPGMAPCIQVFCWRPPPPQSDLQ